MKTCQLKSHESRLDDLIDTLITDTIQEKQEASVDELKRRRIIDGALSGADLEMRASKARVTRRPLFRVAAVIAALVAVLTAAWIWVAPGRDSSPGPSSPSETPTAKVVGERPGQPRSTTAKPSHIHMDFAPGIKAVVTQDTRFTIDRTQLTRITVRISSGAVWVTKDPETRQTQLEMETPKGTVMVTGTVFSVHVDKGSLRVAVLSGTVRVVEEAGPAHTVAAGYLVTVDAEGAEDGPIPQPEATRAEFVQLGILEKDDVPAPSPVQTVATRAKPPGGHKPSSPEPGEQRVSAKDLLSQISLLRQQKDWVQMSTTYRRLIRDHRRSSQAGLAMVSLGNLLIEKLDDPKKAIRWFDVYLKSNTGALVPEALFGKAKALRRLGNRRAELAVLKEIVKRYPESLYARRAAEWIADREQK